MSLDGMAAEAEREGDLRRADAGADRMRRDNARLRHERDTATAELDDLRRTLGLYTAARTGPVVVPEWTTTAKSAGGHRGVVMASMTDWHLEEVVRPEEIFGLNAYSREIALRRVRLWSEKVVSLPRTYMKGIRLDGLVVCATGDLFTGEIHAELRESNEARLLASMLYWQEPVLAALDLLDREYRGHVAVNAVVGNHGRLSQKPVFKGRVHDNAEWLFWSVIRDRLADRKSRVTVNVSPSMDLDVEVYGRHWLLTHGDQFRGGSGISGAFAPLSLGAHRKAKRQSAAGMPMEAMVMGHFHQLINIPGVIAGGCLKGYDEYAFGMNFPPADASQAMWVTSPERAQVNWMPVFVQDRKAEGW